MGDSSSGSPERLCCSPFLCGRKLFFGRARRSVPLWTATIHHHFHGHSGTRALGHVRLISFLVLRFSLRCFAFHVYMFAFLFQLFGACLKDYKLLCFPSLPVSLLIPAPRCLWPV
jgi:hypothetical protein